MHPERRVGWSRITRWVLLSGAGLFVLVYVAVALARMAHPFELEWLEGSMLLKVHRVLEGAPIYVAPSLDYTPFLYAPLHVWVAAGVSWILGPSFFALRLVSFLSSIGALVLIWRITRRETGDAESAFLATTLFAATYVPAGAWLDLGKPDSLSLFLLLAAVDAYRASRGVRGAAAAGALLGLAVLAKQSVLLVAFPVALWALALERRRALASAASFALVFGGVTAVLHGRSDGWSTFYMFELASGHPTIPEKWVGFWTEDLLRPLPIGAIVGIATLGWLGRRSLRSPREVGFMAALAVGLLGAAWAARLHTGSYLNVLIPAFVALSILCAAAAHAVRSWAGRLPRGGELVVIGIHLVAGVQFLLLVYDPRAHVPALEDRAVGRAVVRELSAMEGEVWVAGQPYLASRAGKPHLAHAVALHDVLRAGESPVRDELKSELLDAFETRRFSAIVLDSGFPEECPPRAPVIDGINWLCAEIHANYVQERRLLPPGRFRPVTGARRAPAELWVARSPEVEPWP